MQCFNKFQKIVKRTNKHVLENFLHDWWLKMSKFVNWIKLNDVTQYNISSAQELFISRFACVSIIILLIQSWEMRKVKWNINFNSNIKFWDIKVNDNLIYLMIINVTFALIYSISLTIYILKHVKRKEIFFHL